MQRLLLWLTKLARIDRRYVFLIMLLAVALPLLVPGSFRARPGAETRRFDAALDQAIASPKPVIIGVDFGPQTMAEMEPILLGVMHKLFARKKPVIFLTFMTESTALVQRYLAEMAVRYHLVNGEDYVYLGYAAAYYVAIYAMGTSIGKYFHADDRGVPLEEIPLMQKVKSLGDAAAVISVASNTMPQHWITWAVAPFGIPLLMACTATQATDYYPYLQTGQVRGIIGGGRAGAEYETLLIQQGILDKPGDASRGLGSQSLALLAIIGLIVAGNIGYFAARRQARGPER